MAQMLRALVAFVSLADPAQPAGLVDNGELMDLFIKPAYVELQEAVAQPPADRKAWATIYQKAIRLAEMQNLLFYRSHPDATKPEWTAAAASTRQAAADVARAALLGLRTVKPENFEAVRTNYAAVADHCNACHRTFAREAPAVKP